MPELNLIKTYRPSSVKDPVEKTVITLNEYSIDEIYRVAFKKYVNPSSRSYTVSYEFEDKEHNIGFNKWCANPGNYAFNGGDMS